MWALHTTVDAFLTFDEMWGECKIPASSGVQDGAEEYQKLFGNNYGPNGVK